MTVQKIKTVLFFILLPTVACKAQGADAITAYIETYRTFAIDEMRRTGVPAAIKLAQGIHETMAGQSMLVLKSNNHFGIKCKTGYSGPYVLHDDDRPNEHFMKYEDPWQSYRDHSDFLRKGSRYRFLFDLDPLDYKSWAYGLKKAGYATNPRYPQLLIGLIEKYNLQDYSLMAVGKMEMPWETKTLMTADQAPVPEPTYPQGAFQINKSRVVFVSRGTDLVQLAAHYNIPLSWLYKFNDFNQTTVILKSDQLVYLQLKRTIGEQAYHQVTEGETLADIAQSEGVRLASILKYNQIGKSDRPVPGTRLRLQAASETVAIN